MNTVHTFGVRAGSNQENTKAMNMLTMYAATDDTGKVWVYLCRSAVVFLHEHG